MIDYNPREWGICFIFALRGSVLPRAVALALPNAAIAALLHTYMSKEEVLKNWDMDGFEKIWSGYTFVLGFLLVFRNSQAYTRFWEGSTLIQQVRGEWFNAYSSLLSFSSDAANPERVEEFQHMIARFMSILYCAGLQQVAQLDDDTLEILDTEGFDEDCLDYLQDVNDRVEVLLQWVQRSILDARRDKLIDVEPPILSRVFQELSRGIVNLQNVRKIKDIPFPFPYAQIISCMLMVHWLITPIFASQAVPSPYWAGAVSFFVICVYWAPFYIALEIDQPFGSDSNDLPIREMQEDFNKSLLQLLDKRAQTPPAYKMPARHRKMSVARLEDFRVNSSIALSSSSVLRRANTVAFGFADSAGSKPERKWLPRPFFSRQQSLPLPPGDPPEYKSPRLLERVSDREASSLDSRPTPNDFGSIEDDESLMPPSCVPIGTAVLESPRTLRTLSEPTNPTHRQSDAAPTAKPSLPGVSSVHLHAPNASLSELQARTAHIRKS
eukprot:TRINITY_DN8569_c0_g1_i1.p1 TRINITY_DN8569_c0_g1~~TRINITY_DN8569_c0_g1_i1.p1  ORF type:complete len:496 (-),score=51.52 TRINITY_DN8569_c0_g1_i1:198-1685(-)